MAESGKEDCVATVTVDNERMCWGCGLRLLPPTHGGPVFKCGWCGAITNHNVFKPQSQCRRWRRFRDRCFVSILFIFILFIISGGVWGAFPIIFSVSYINGIIHSIITTILAVTTVSTFGLSAFQCAGAPPMILWGSYMVVGKDELQNYTFCNYCSKPKSPRAHHCRSCGKCILDMDHHCPFIGNCVGAANHRHFVAFLISAILSSIYVSVVCAYASFQIWPTLELNPLQRNHMVTFTVREVLSALLDSLLDLPVRGPLLVYLFISSILVELSLSVLLWQQLSYIYEGRTYINHLTSQEGDPVNEKDCQNLLRFFGCCRYSRLRFLPAFSYSPKRHKK